MPGGARVQLLDTARTVPTPEGVALTLRLAGPLPRGAAWAIDVLIRIALYLLLGMVLAFLGKTGLGFFLIAVFLMEWLYPALCEAYWRGATPGKKAMKLVVLHDDGTPVGWSAALIRNALWPVDFLPLCYGFGLLCTLIQRDFKRIGDIAAGTVVTYTEDKRPRIKPTDLPALPPPLPLRPDERQAIVDFANRAAALTPERAAELAELTGPLVAPYQGEAARQRLLRIARFLLGDRPAQNGTGASS